ncbi:aldose 1-epimerase [soil metagenome]
MHDDPGHAIELASSNAVATVFPAAGGRLGQITVGGRPLLRGPEYASEGWAAWGSYPLAPWSNRIPGGHLAIGDQTFDLPVNWPDGSAIHGLVAQRPWTVAAESAAEVTLRVDAELAPYHISCTQRFALAADGLEHHLDMTNIGAETVPFGLGIHPWFVAGDVEVPADRLWPGETLPAGPPRPVRPDEDLRRLRPPPPMDRGYCGLTGSAARVGPVRLTWHGPITNVVVYSGEPGWVCVEPVTMATDGFGLAERGSDEIGVVALAPDAALSVRYRYEWPGLDAASDSE